MAPKTCSCSSSLALFLMLNVLFFALVTAKVDCPNPPKPKPNPKPKPPSPVRPKPTPTPTPKEHGCPRDVLKLGVCSSVLDGKHNFSMGVPNSRCCSFFHGLVDFDAAICLCTALKANICGFNVNIPISFNMLFNFCSLQAPSNFKCLP